MSSLPLSPISPSTPGAPALPAPSLREALAKFDTDTADAAAPGMQWRDDAVRCNDGRLLAARWAEPLSRPPRAIVVMSPATAVPARFYRAFCEWLAGRGYAVLSFDLRGVGESKAALLPGEDVRLRDWARVDMGGALHAAERRRLVESEAQGRRLKLLWIGHSLGGNSIGLVPGFECIDGIVGVAAQVAHWRLWQGWAKVQAFTFFHLLPLIVRVFGHGPGRLLGPRAENLPAGAALEWAAWGRTRGFLFGDDTLQHQRGYHRYEGEVHLWNITDDHLFGPAGAVDALAAEFKRARVQRHTLAPADVGARRIEHFGPFRREFGPRLWERLLRPVEAALALEA